MEQQARVNFARALYQTGDIYLFDDPLSALDTRVGKLLFHECIKEHLDGKLRILVTHQLQYLSMADHVIVLSREGGIWAQGTYDELLRSGIDFTSLISEEYLQSMTADDLPPETEEDKEENLERSESRTTGGGDRSSSQDRSEHNRLLSQSPVLTKTKQEAKAVGSVGLGMYFRYFRSGGSIITIVFLVLAFLTTQVLYNGVDYWVSLWTNSITENAATANETRTNAMNDTTDNTTGLSLFREFFAPKKFTDDSTEQSFYAYVYSGLMGGFILISVFRSILFFRYCMKISINIHDSMFRSLVRVPVKFFTDHPSGRIMNRFTKDLNHMDEYLPISFYDFMNIFLTFLGMLAINVVANYYTAVPAFIMLVSLWRLRSFYLATARDLKRLESVGMSIYFLGINV